MGINRLSVAGIILATALVACSGSNGSVQPADLPTDEPDAVVDTWVEDTGYRGTATVHIQFCGADAEGTVTCNDESTYSSPVQLVAGPALACDSADETNSFQLYIISAQDNNAPHNGEFNLLSSVDPTGGLENNTGDCSLHQYWSYRLEGTSLVGTLIDPGSDHGLSWNLIWTTHPIAPVGGDKLLPSYIDRGATLSGSFTDQNAQLHVEGTTVDKLRTFSIDVTARRMN